VGRFEGANAAHHVGEGLASPRSRDDLAIPLCDRTCSPYTTRNCHHTKAHGSRKAYYRDKYRPLSPRYRERYLDMTTQPTPPVEVPSPVVVETEDKKKKDKPKEEDK